MRRILVQWSSALGLGLLLVAAGCSGSGGTLNNQVEGTVKLDGVPLANAVIQFVPDVEGLVQAPQSNGTTDTSGHFTLTCENKRPGAILGKHNVIVIVGRGDDNRTNDMDPPPKSATDNSKTPKVPQFYSVVAKTPLQIEVTADKHTGYDLELSTRAKPRMPK
jgi:hypothetical protein